jgi:hypothetical protein
MAAGSGNIVTGFIEGLIKTNGTEVIVLPFADKIGGATFRYASENLMVETFSQQGIKGASGSCPFREECSMELTSENLAWSFLQAATNTLAEDSDQLRSRSISVVLTDTDDGPPEVSEYVLDDVEVSLLGDVYAADEDGIQYDVEVAVSGGDSTFTFDADLTGKKVTIYYQLAASGTNNLIKFGSGQKLGEVGVYGRFFGCPENYQVVIPRGIIQSNLEMSAGDGPGSAALTVMALRNNVGDYAYLERF